MSLNIISVTLNMDTVNFLGISIVGQSNKFGDGDCGIYVGSIMKGNFFFKRICAKKGLHVYLLWLSLISTNKKSVNKYACFFASGGAVALDGRIEPGDMILQVNETNFENMTNDDAVRVLREVVTKPG